jgi:hypothetical protein
VIRRPRSSRDIATWISAGELASFPVRGTAIDACASDTPSENADQSGSGEAALVRAGWSSALLTTCGVGSGRNQGWARTVDAGDLDGARGSRTAA